jgi:O-antigen ligase
VPPVLRRTADGLLAFTAAALSLSTTGMQAGVVALGVLALLARLAGWRVMRRTPLDGVLLLFFGTLALSTLASGHPLQAVGWARVWVVLAYFAVFWWLRDAAHAARLVRVVVAAGALVAAYGILQHFTGADWYRAALGRETVVRPRVSGGSGYAVVGFFRNYLTFAHTMLFPLLWGAALALRGALLGWVAVPLLVAAILFSSARGVWLAGLAGGTALLLASGSRRRLRLALAATAVAGVLFALVPDLRAQAASIFTTRGENAARVGIYRANLDIVRARPALGLGFGRYAKAARPFYAAHPTADRRSHAHNDYLQIATEAGLAGLGAFALLYVAALRRGWRALTDAPDAGAWAAAAGAWTGLVAFLVGGLTQYNFGDNEVALTMWVALAVLMRCREDADATHERMSA